jgi:hypothetical protein
MKHGKEVCTPLNRETANPLKGINMKNVTKHKPFCQETDTYYITLPELSTLVNQITKCDVRTIRRWVTIGYFAEIKSINVADRIKFDLASVQEFLAQVLAGTKVIGKKGAL